MASYAIWQVIFFYMEMVMNNDDDDDDDDDDENWLKEAKRTHDSFNL